MLIHNKFKHIQEKNTHKLKHKYNYKHTHHKHIHTHKHTNNKNTQTNTIKETYTYTHTNTQKHTNAYTTYTITKKGKLGLYNIYINQLKQLLTNTNKTITKYSKHKY